MKDAALSRPSFAEIRLGNLQFNLQLLRQHRPGLQVIAIVKADAYGHGAVEVSKHLLQQGVSSFGVATLEEAQALRGAGLSSEILVLGCLDERYLNEAVNLGLGLSAWDESYLHAVESAAARNRKKAGIHLKVDTGMARLGFLPDQIPALLQKFEQNTWPHLFLASAFTHLSNADVSPDLYSQEQLGKFLNMAWPRGLRLHAANSAAVLRYSQTQFSSFRPGIFLYGGLDEKVHPLARKQKPVLSLHSRLIRIRELKKGEGVSYGQSFKANKKMSIATLPIGYADGVPRYLSNQGEALVDGKRCKILGRVCMDLCMIDISKVPSAKLGSLATLLGRQGSEEIKVADWAAIGKTISYEVLCGISSRVPRYYLS